MDSINYICPTHNDNKNIVCTDCHKLLCLQCVYDMNQFGIHKNHELISFNCVIENQKKDLNMKIIKNNILLSDYQSNLDNLIKQRDTCIKLKDKNDLELLFQYMGTDNINCITHNNESIAVCIQCNVFLCLECVLDNDAMHHNHSKKTIKKMYPIIDQYYKTLISELDNKIYNISNTLKKINLENDNHNDLLLKNVDEIFTFYLRQNGISNALSMASDNNNLINYSIHQLDEAEKLNLTYDNNYTILENNYTLQPGYYLIIVIGGGASGGCTCRYKGATGVTHRNYYALSGKNGDINACIVQVFNPIVITPYIGLGGVCQGTNPFNKLIVGDYINGGKTSVIIGDDIIEALGGKNKLSDLDSYKREYKASFHRPGMKIRYYYNNKISDTQYDDNDTIKKISKLFPLIRIGKRKRYCCTGNYGKIIVPVLEGSDGFCIDNHHDCFNLEKHNVTGEGYGAGGGSMGIYELHGSIDIEHCSNGNPGCVIVVNMCTQNIQN